MRKKSSPFSDQGPENPKLGNRPPQRNRPAPPTSGMTGQDGLWDYFREPQISAPSPDRA